VLRLLRAADLAVGVLVDALFDVGPAAHRLGVQPARRDVITGQFAGLLERQQFLLVDGKRAEEVVVVVAAEEDPQGQDRRQQHGLPGDHVAGATADVAPDDIVPHGGYLSDQRTEGSILGTGGAGRAWSSRSSRASGSAATCSRSRWAGLSSRSSTSRSS